MIQFTRNFHLGIKPNFKSGRYFSLPTRCHSGVHNPPLDLKMKYDAIVIGGGKFCQKNILFIT